MVFITYNYTTINRIIRIVLQQRNKTTPKSTLFKKKRKNKKDVINK